MILSAQQLFSDDQVVTVSADSTNVIDLGVPATPYGAAAALNRDIGKGAKIPLLVQVTADFATCTSVTINLSTGAAATLGTTIASQTILVADLVAGKQINLDFLPNGIVERYLGIEYVVTGTDAGGGGSITAGMAIYDTMQFIKPDVSFCMLYEISQCLHFDPIIGDTFVLVT